MQYEIILQDFFAMSNHLHINHQKKEDR